MCSFKSHYEPHDSAVALLAEVFLSKPVFNLMQTLNKTFSLSAVRYRVPPSRCRHLGRLLQRVFRDHHQGQHRRRLRAP